MTLVSLVEIYNCRKHREIIRDNSSYMVVRSRRGNCEIKRVIVMIVYAYVKIELYFVYICLYMFAILTHFFFFKLFIAVP